jgi:hypothetical protein
LKTGTKSAAALIAVPLPFRPVEWAQVHCFSKLSNLTRGLSGFAVIRYPVYRNQLCHGPTAPSYYDLLATLHSIE